MDSRPSKVGKVSGFAAVVDYEVVSGHTKACTIAYHSNIAFKFRILNVVGVGNAFINRNLAEIKAGCQLLLPV